MYSNHSQTNAAEKTKTKINLQNEQPKITCGWLIIHTLECKIHAHNLHQKTPQDDFAFLEMWQLLVV